jgi:hypothetical protein
LHPVVDSAWLPINPATYQLSINPALRLLPRRLHPTLRQAPVLRRVPWGQASSVGLAGIFVVLVLSRIRQAKLICGPVTVVLPGGGLDGPSTGAG